MVLRRNKVFKFLGVFLALAMLALSVSAHQVSLLELELTQQTDRTYQLELTSNVNTTQPLIRPVLPEQCGYDAEVVAMHAGQPITFWCESTVFQVVEQLRIRWNVNAIHLTSRWLDNTENQKLFYADKQNTISVTLHTLATEVDSWLSISIQYISLGAEHLAGGYDHLLFVVAMCLLLGWQRKLFYSITAFTVAHSVTLAFTYLGWFNLHVAPVEACIALSIAVLAAEVIRKGRGQNGLTFRFPALMCGAIGLLHGLGFAGALTEIGVNPNAILPALLGFNLGLEIAQLFFITGLFIIVFAGQRLISVLTTSTVYQAVLKSAIAYGVGIVAMFWTLQRVLG